MNKDAFITWAGKLGIGEKYAGRIFDTFDNDKDEWLNSFEQWYGWNMIRSAWEEVMEGGDEE